MDTLSPPPTEELPPHDPQTGEIHDNPEAAAAVDDDDEETGLDEDFGPTLDLKTDTLVGDLRDALLARLRTMPKPYTTMSENEQRDLIYGCTNAARHMVFGALRLIAANGMPSIKCTLDSINFKDGAKFVLKASKSDQDLVQFMKEVLDRTGGIFVLSMMSPAAVDGERAPAVPDKDQKELPIAPGGQADNVAAFRAKDAPDTAPSEKED